MYDTLLLDTSRLISAIPGAFGVVSLVRERSTGQLFAMKQVTDIGFHVPLSAIVDVLPIHFHS